MIIFGLSQQMALVHTVASGLISIRPDHFLQFESSLTFMSCLLGLVFSFPMATEVSWMVPFYYPTIAEKIYIPLWILTMRFYNFLNSLVWWVHCILPRLHNRLWLVDYGVIRSYALRHVHNTRKTLLWRKYLYRIDQPSGKLLGQCAFLNISILLECGKFKWFAHKN